MTLCVLTGAVLRLWLFGSLGLTHFDEGIYALSGAWSVSGGSVSSIDPMLIPYAPPGYPILVGLSYQLLGVADASAILVATLLGIGTIPLAAWVGRRSFGPGAGVITALFSAFSMAHVAFSRKALTDVPFLFTWLLALGLGGRLLEQPRLGRAVALGIAVGLAQNFKYNGWLAGIVILLTAVIGAVVAPESRRRKNLIRTFGFGLLAAVVAALIYWPWFDFVERHGGYSALLQHHRNYLDPPTSWISNWKQQLKQANALSGGRAWAVFTWVVVWAGGAWVLHGGRVLSTGSRRGWYRFGVGLIGGAGLFAGFASLSWCAGLILVPRLIVEDKPGSRIIAVWWTLLSILTPFYHPYARLWLPLEACGWLLLTGAVVRLDPFGSQGVAPPSEASHAQPRRLVSIFTGVLASIVLVLQPSADPFPFGRIYQATTSIRDGVARLATAPVPGLATGDELRVLGRRPFEYYLLLQGRFPFRLAASLETLSSRQNQGKWLLIDSVQVTQDSGTNALPAILENQSSRHRLWTEKLDPITLLDVRPSAAESRAGERPAETWLVRLETVPGISSEKGAHDAPGPR